MKIVFVVNTFRNLGGAEAAVEQEAVELAGRGHDVTVVALATGVRRQSGVPVTVVGDRPTVGPRDVTRLIPKVRRELRRLEPDVVIAHLFPASVVAALCRPGQTPLVITKQNTGPAKGTAARWAERWASARAVEVHAVTSAVLRSPLGWPELAPGTPFAVVPNPAPAPRTAPAVGGRDGRRERSVLFLGRLAAQKDLPTLLDAWARFAVTGVEGVRLVIAGDGPKRAAVEARAASLPGVDVIGEVDRAAADALLAGADVLVLSSAWEGLPLVVLEALAVGTPVVGTRVGGMSDLVVDGCNGFLVPPGDPDALAARLADALEQRDELSAACRASVADLSAADVAVRLERRLADAVVSRRRVAVVGRAWVYADLRGWLSQPADTRFLAAAMAALDVDVELVARADDAAHRQDGYDARLPDEWRVVPIAGSGRTRSARGIRNLFDAVLAVWRSVRRADVAVVMLADPVTLVALPLARLARRPTVAYWGLDLASLLRLWLPSLRSPGAASRVARVAMALPAVNLSRRPQPGTVPIAGPTVHRDDVFVGARRGVPARPSVGFAGTRSMRKGFDVFVDIVAALAARGIHADVVVIGRRSDADGAEDALARRGSVHDLGFLGDTARYADALAGLDVLLVPSRVEGRSRAVHEALLAGVPVVASTAAGYERGELDGLDIVDGLVADEWADRLGWLTDDVARRDRREAARRAGDALARSATDASAQLADVVAGLLP